MNGTTKSEYLADTIVTYLADKRKTTPSVATLTKYTYILNGFKTFVGGKSYGTDENTEIQPLAVVEWRNSLKNEKTGEELKPNSIAHAMTILHSFFAWAVDHQIYEKNPVLKRDYPKKEKVQLNGLLTEQEIRTIISGRLPSNVHRQVAYRTRAIIILACESGLRSQELLGLRYSDLDFKHSLVKVRKEVAKGRKERTAPLPPQAVQYINDYLLHTPNGNEIKSCKDKNTPLFGIYDERTGVYKPIDRRVLLTEIKAYISRLIGKDGVGTHDLRHAFASWCLSNGVNVQNLQSVLGHSSIVTTMRYAEQLQPQRVAQDLCGLFVLNNRTESHG